MEEMILAHVEVVRNTKNVVEKTHRILSRKDAVDVMSAASFLFLNLTIF